MNPKEEIVTFFDEDDNNILTAYKGIYVTGAPEKLYSDKTGKILKKIVYKIDHEI